MGATTGREAISAQDIRFLGVATDEAIDKVDDALSERLRIISGTGIERGESFGEAGEEVTDWGGETGGESKTESESEADGVDGFEPCNEDFGFFASRVRSYSWILVLLSELLLQRLHVYLSIRSLARRTSSCCFNNSFAS